MSSVNDRDPEGLSNRKVVHVFPILAEYFFSRDYLQKSSTFSQLIKIFFSAYYFKSEISSTALQ